jgi:hypothetical protein
MGTGRMDEFRKAAMRVKSVYRSNGGASTGPRTAAGRAKCAGRRHYMSGRPERCESSSTTSRAQALPRDASSECIRVLVVRLGYCT